MISGTVGAEADCWPRLLTKPAAITGAPSSTKHPNTTRNPKRNGHRPVSIWNPTNATANTHRLSTTGPNSTPSIHSSDDAIGEVSELESNGDCREIAIRQF